MSDITDRYRRLSDAFAAKLAAVPPDGWSRPTPCEGWTVRELVAHVIDSQGLFLGLVGHELGDLPSVDDDPVAAWDAARAKVQAHLDDPELAAAEYEGMFGRLTFAQGVDRFLSADLVVHGWDLARAVGLDETIDPEEVERGLRDFPEMGDAMRQPGGFGPAIEPVPGADPQTRLLNFLGRQP